MQHPQFEAVKVAIKQDKTGYILTLNIHPDDIDERIMRDFVGARYMVVMARINAEEQPMNRDSVRDPVRAAGMLCRDQSFADWLLERHEIFEANESEAIAWLQAELNVTSRSELKNNPTATMKLWSIEQEYKTWKQNA